MSNDIFDIICGASLYWETTLWQRPHQIISRLALYHQILYVRPLDWRIYRKNRSTWAGANRFMSPVKNLSLFSPLIFPFGREIPFAQNLNNRLMTSRIKKECLRMGTNKKILWLYSPMSFYLIDKLGESLVVYDCMDDHSSFLNADFRLRKMEDQLLNRADIVFAGGKSLYESVKTKNSNCFLFPSAVDSEHFGMAMMPETSVPEDIKNLPRPVIGYFGAIDERLDYELIETLASKNQNYSFVLIGPVLKIRQADLPVRDNIHYLGQKEYKDLPAYLKGFDIGLMPFAQTSLTRMISPTKSLEYLAAGVPLISTPVPDVIEDFEGIIHIGRDAYEISGIIKGITDCKEPDRIKRGIEIASQRSWDETVNKMRRIIIEHEDTNNQNSAIQRP